MAKSKSRARNRKSRSSSSAKKYETTDGKKFSEKSDATKHQRSLGTSGGGRSSGGSSSVNYNFDSKNESVAEYNNRIEKERASVNARGKDKADDEEQKADEPFYSSTEFTASDEYQALGAEDQKAVLAVFGAVAGNDKVKAGRLMKAFQAASKQNDPYFAQQLKLSIDAIERGYVSIDKEAQFKELQLQSRLEDTRADYANRKDFLNLEQASDLKEIERAYSENLDMMRNDLAASGFSQSSRRAQKEGILSQVTGDMRESKNRTFAFQQGEQDRSLGRSQRDTAAEIKRLRELTTEGKLDFLRKGEERVGSKNLPRLTGAPQAMGGIYGALPEEKLSNTISAALSYVF